MYWIGEICLTFTCFCWHTSSMDKGSGVLRQHTAVSQPRVSENGCLPRKHPHTCTMPSDNQTCVSKKQIQINMIHVCLHAPGRGNCAGLLGMWGPRITDSSWPFLRAERRLVGLTRLPLCGVNDGKHLRRSKFGNKYFTQFTKHMISIQTCRTAVSRSQMNTAFW